MILAMLQALEKETSTKLKQELLKSLSNKSVLKLVVAMALDKVKYSYGIQQIPNYEEKKITMSLEQALDLLLANIPMRGNAGRALLADILSHVPSNDAEVIKRIIRRDLKCGVGRTMTNKVWKDLVTKPPYMRCNTFTSKTKKHIAYPALLQEKCDGRFLYTIKDGDNVTYMSRQGEESDFPQLSADFLHMPDGVYVGELLVRGLNNRAEANGLLNSDDSTEANVYVQLWDYLTLDEFTAKQSIIPYTTRLGYLSLHIGKLKSTRLYLVETVQVNDSKEALTIVGQWMAEGREGGVLKDMSLPFKDHTSNQQLKLKLEMSIEVRCLGFTEGTTGTKREKTFGALVFANDEGTIKGQTSGFTDEMLFEISNNRDKYIGKIVEVEFNDLSKARDSDIYALSHPRFVKFRDDKVDTNTLAEALAIKEMAFGLQ